MWKFQEKKDKTWKKINEILFLKELNNHMIHLRENILQNINTLDMYIINLTQKIYSAAEVIMLN